MEFIGAKMKKKIKLHADYYSFPVWWVESDTVVCFDPSQLPITSELLKRLMNWQDQYDSTLNMNDPIESGFENDIEEELFESEGLSLWAELREELLGEYDVYYFSDKYKKLIKSPNEL
jgi:hypothetical protein